MEAVAVLRVLSIFIFAATVSGEFNLTILHTNDVHARIEQASQFGARCTNKKAAANQCYGGVARRKTALDKQRKENENTLFLDGGDQFQGTTWFELYNGDEAAHFMKKLEYDAMTIGNHEFDRGTANLGRFLKNVSDAFPVVAANIDASTEPTIRGLFKKSVVLERGGHKIGIIGYTFKDTNFISQTGPNLVFNEEIPAIQEEAKRLSEQGVKIIIALGHSGYDTDREVARQVPEIDAVVGGHSNTFLYTGKKPSNEDPEGLFPTIITQPSGKKVPVVQAFFFGKYLGVLHLTFDDNGDVTQSVGNPVLLDGRIAEDPELLKDVKEWGQAVKDYGEAEVGESYVWLNEACSMGECNLGNLVTDAIVKMSLKKPTVPGEWATASAAIWNGGGIRSPIQAGRILRNDIIATLPFRNTVTQVEISGANLTAAFEYNVEEYGIDNIAGRFLQVSGIHVKYDVRKPPGQRVVSLEMLCTKCQEPRYEKVKPDVDYLLLMSNFLRNGGAKHLVLRNSVKNEVELGTLGGDLVADYINKYSPITHGTEGRIQFVEVDSSSAGNTPIGSISIIFLSILISIKHLF